MATLLEAGYSGDIQTHQPTPDYFRANCYSSCTRKGYNIGSPATTVILRNYLPLTAMGNNGTVRVPSKKTLGCDGSRKGYNVGSPATTVILRIYLPLTTLRATYLA
ncbi:hypothetical protein J6590_071468 [Homalodisca vitripennis]|nr:hypothetical protein J6590_071468 [Homalodisca vitripennis]